MAESTTSVAPAPAQQTSEAGALASKPRRRRYSLLTRQDKTILAPQYAEAWGSFSPDSRSLVFAKGNPGGYDSTLTLARADGSRQRQLSSRTQYYAFGGPWLYYIDESDAGFSFYRLEPPDGAAELIASFPDSLCAHVAQMELGELKKLQDKPARP